ncbi:hypothetical protein ES703_10936 [subsurface metagenome]
MEKDYFGEGGYINGLGFRVEGERPVTFSKSLLTDIDEEEFYIDQFGIKRRKKKRATELQDINVEEISYVSEPAIRKKFMIIKGDGDIMDEDILKAISEEELKTIRETISILNKAKPTGDLKTATETLEKFFAGKKPYPYPYPVKKIEKSTPKWTTAQRQIFGYSEEDLDNLDYEEEDLEIEKSNNANPFPSLARVFNRNKEVLEEVYELATMEERAI